MEGSKVSQAPPNGASPNSKDSRQERGEAGECPREAPFPVSTQSGMNQAAPLARTQTWVCWLVLPARRGFGTGSAPRELDQFSHFRRMRHDWCCSQIHLPLPFSSWICISPLGSSFQAHTGLCWGLLPPRAPFRFPPPRAQRRVPPSFPSNCYVKIPRTCFCKELKEGEEGIVFVSVSPSL